MMLKTFSDWLEEGTLLKTLLNVNIAALPGLFYRPVSEEALAAPHHLTWLYMSTIKVFSKSHIL